ncbi:uncharacterized protein LOC111284431 [Durio zibethinus]|uniref:Uncharacterized protein LOC111284431 n=1 Tax=Durio zibethinus TaxID=66656 RepID=A0A6P5XKV6_DURZI|nr:uncharacterized protein LOC111284431 [Durio zibethinus]
MAKLQSLSAFLFSSCPLPLVTLNMDFFLISFWIDPLRLCLIEWKSGRVGRGEWKSGRKINLECVKRYVYISAADFGLVNYLLQGYYEGKMSLLDYLLLSVFVLNILHKLLLLLHLHCFLFARLLLMLWFFTSLKDFTFSISGVILRPGFICGTRSVGRVKLTLGVVGSPMEMVLQHAKPLNQLPLVGPLFTPPVNVTSVAKVAVRAATDPVFPPGIVDFYGIQRFS